MFGLLIFLRLIWLSNIILTGLRFGIGGAILALLASVILVRILLAIGLCDPDKRRRSPRGSVRDLNDGDARTEEE